LLGLSGCIMASGALLVHRISCEGIRLGDLADGNRRGKVAPVRARGAAAGRTGLVSWPAAALDRTCVAV